MSRIFAIATAELGVLCRSPAAWVLTAVFLFAAGYGFATSPATHLETSMRGALSWILFALMFLVPALAARLVTREFEEGTIELTLTAPVSDLEVIAGMYLAGLLTVAGWLAGTLPLAGLLALYGDPDWAVLLSSYLGIALVASLFLALATLGAALARNQALGFVLGAGLILAVWFSGALLSLVPAVTPEAQAALSLANQFDELASGIVDLRAIVLPVSVATVALFLAVRVIETRRWL
ncbi:MAG: ABC transporter permease [Minwuia sp.]|uniref:ABC transporter permease n=1 Tax=Minwuia sp. TaxID=2493630 RepID=UPI003A88FAB8